MNHQPYEAWILEDIQISPKEKRILDQHLAECPHCAHLAQSWTDARQMIKTAPVVSAPVGFSQRWQNNLEARKLAHKKHQTRIMILSFVVTAVAVLITLGAFLLPPISPITILVNILSALVKLVSAVTQFWFFVGSFIQAAPKGLVLGLLTLIMLWVGITIIAWSVSLYRITLKGIRTTK